MRISILFLLLAATACSTAKESTNYHLSQTIPLAGVGGWDYAKVDFKLRRVYITHTTKVDVLDADSGKQVGVIDGLHGVHGIAWAHDLGHGFITNGKSNSVTVFNIDTLKIIDQITVGKKPDALVYNESTQRVVVFNGDDNNATVIDAKTNKTIGVIALGAGPEFAVSGDKEHVFVNLEDTNEVLKLDVAKLQVLERWKVTPGESPASLGMDKKNHRLFIGCRNKLLVVINADNGQVITSLPIGDHVDATMFDREEHHIISSSGDGVLTIITQDDADHYHVAQTVVTQKGSKNFALDKKTHKLFVPAAEFAPKSKVTKENPKAHPAVTDGSFKVLVFEQ
jgi:YVTN family beta-propeller protein